MTSTLLDVACLCRQTSVDPAAQRGSARLYAAAAKSGCAKRTSPSCTTRIRVLRAGSCIGSVPTGRAAAAACTSNSNVSRGSAAQPSGNELVQRGRDRQRGDPAPKTRRVLVQARVRRTGFPAAASVRRCSVGRVCATPSSSFKMSQSRPHSARRRRRFRAAGAPGARVRACRSLAAAGRAT